MCADSVAAVVIDNGSRVSRAGFAGGDSPSFVFPSAVATRTSRGPGFGEIAYVGDEAKSKAAADSALGLKYAVTEGIVVSWDYMEKLWAHIFSDLLHVSPEEHPLLLTEHQTNPKISREKTLQVMFETFKVPSLYLAAKPALSLFASGVTSGVVFSCSDGVSYCIPVYEGHVIPHAQKHVYLAGRDVTDNLGKKLMERGFSFSTVAEFERVRDIKEKLCYVALDFEQELKNAESNASLEKSYRLPDGREITIGKERFQCPESLFQPTLIDMRPPAVHEIIYYSMKKYDEELLPSCVLLTGGTTMLPGFAERMKKELTALLAPSVERRIITSREHSAWVGGSVLASLSPFQHMSISRLEYEEFGPHIVYHKCF